MPVGESIFTSPVQTKTYLHFSLGPPQSPWLKFEQDSSDAEDSKTEDNSPIFYELWLAL